MNLRQGKIGRQEAFSVGVIAACATAIFTPDSEALYARGNSAYITMLISAVLALIIFLVAARAMQISKAKNLWELLRMGLGPVFGRVAAVLLALLIAFAAAALLSRFTLMIGRFIFPTAKEWELLIYMVIAAGVPAWLGLEGLGRAGRLLIWVIGAALLGALALATGNYEIHRLAPYLGDGAMHIAELSARGINLFFPALLGLLIAAQGLHGVLSARKAGYVVGVTGGLMASVCQLCMGMMYSYQNLREMHSPMYRLTMGFQYGGMFPRVDTLLVFGWALGGMLAAGYYMYTAALLFAQTFHQADARPGIAIYTGMAGALALLMHMHTGFLETLMEYLSKFGYILAALPVLLAALLAPSARFRREIRLEKRRRRAAVLAESEQAEEESPIYAEDEMGDGEAVDGERGGGQAENGEEEPV